MSWGSDNLLRDELSEAACRLTDKLNRLLDEDLKSPERSLSNRQTAIAHRTIEHISIAEELIEVLRGVDGNERRVSNKR